jgi:uncharacterized protein
MTATQRDGRPLTVPPELDTVEPVVPTANEYVALPDIDPRTGAIPSANLLHLGACGLVEFLGSPLSTAEVAVGGIPLPDDAWDLQLDAGFLPVLTARHAGCAIEQRIFCPPGHKGFVQVLSVENATPRVVDAVVGFSGSFERVRLQVFSGRDVEGPHRCAWNDWTRSLIWEANTGLPLAALAVRSGDGAAPDSLDQAGPLPTGWSHRRSPTIEPGERATLVLYWGVGSEADGAGLVTIDLARHGWRTLLEETRRRLLAWQARPIADAPQLHALRERNRLFCLFFAAGRTIDTEELVLVTSRSPRYYVAGAHWTRDSLLWAFPAILEVDHALAAEWLRVAFARYGRNPGIHALYLDGRVLYPGFELDELCAFFVALEAYLDVTGDLPILEDPALAARLPQLEAELERHRDPTTGLYTTFLLSSDDPAPLPFVTYGNALAVVAHRVLARIHHAQGDLEAAERAQDRADTLWQAVLQRCTVDGPSGRIFAGAVDGEGTSRCFDEPSGSLELLGHYGLLAADDPLLLATVDWIHSADNPHGPQDGAYGAPMCPHATHPWLLAVGNALLRGDVRWLDRLPEMPLDGGLACETFDVATGQPRTGTGFATCAGWLAHAIDRAVGQDTTTVATAPGSAETS